jgi:four helix bundle protein
MNKSTITKHSFDLEERTLKFAKSVLNLCRQLTQNVINKELISQLVRSSGSVGANYQEANDSLSKKDFRHRIKITRKEAKETHYWLELLKEANTQYSNEINPLINEALELREIFSSIVDKSS